jgi:hypothetical protein
MGRVDDIWNIISKARRVTDIEALKRHLLGTAYTLAFDCFVSVREYIELATAVSDSNHLHNTKPGARHFECWAMRDHGIPRPI